MKVTQDTEKVSKKFDQVPEGLFCESEALNQAKQD